MMGRDASKQRARVASDRFCEKSATWLDDRGNTGLDYEQDIILIRNITLLTLFFSSPKRLLQRTLPVSRVDALPKISLSFLFCAPSLRLPD